MLKKSQGKLKLYYCLFNTIKGRGKHFTSLNVCVERMAVKGGWRLLLQLTFCYSGKYKRHCIRGYSNCCSEVS